MKKSTESLLDKWQALPKEERINLYYLIREKLIEEGVLRRPVPLTSQDREDLKI